MEMEISWSIGANAYCCLMCILYDKLLKPRQSFRITLYLVIEISSIEILDAASASLSSDWRRQTSWEQEKAYKQL
jgi:hypothetical protein